MMIFAQNITLLVGEKLTNKQRYLALNGARQRKTIWLMMIVTIKRTIKRETSTLSHIWLHLALRPG